jgi:hypothetical protein
MLFRIQYYTALIGILIFLLIFRLIQKNRILQQYPLL